MAKIFDEEQKLCTQGAIYATYDQQPVSWLWGSARTSTSWKSTNFFFKNLAGWSAQLNLELSVLRVPSNSASPGLDEEPFASTERPNKRTTLFELPLTGSLSCYDLDLLCKLSFELQSRSCCTVGIEPVDSNSLYPGHGRQTKSYPEEISLTDKLVQIQKSFTVVNLAGASGHTLCACRIITFPAKLWKQTTIQQFVSSSRSNL